MNKILNILFFIVLLFSFENLMAQSQPGGILFQAVARDVSGNAAATRTIYAIVEIREATSTGSVAYSESHQVMSNEDGIFNLIIGNGARLTGTTKFDNLNWRFQIYFINLKVAVAPSIPTPGWDLAKEYVDMGTSQIWAVPYAFTAFKAVVADSAVKIGGIVYGENGGTGVSNIGKTITLGKNFEIQGLGNLKFTTIGTTSLNLPISGTLVTRENLDTLSNKYLVSPVFIGKPKTPNPDSLSNDSTVANTYFVKLNLKNQISSLRTDLSSTIDSSSGLNLRLKDTATMLTNRIKRDTSFLLQKKDTISLSNRIDKLTINTTAGVNLKLNISDTSVMLSKRIERDTISLSNRIDLKVNTLNAIIDSSLYVNGKTTITDSLLAKANVVIDSNLYVKGGLRLGGKLQLDSGLVFKDSLTVTRGARIDSSLLVKGKIFVNDSLIVKGISVLTKIKTDSTVLSDSISKKVNIRDTAAMLSNRFARDTAALAKYKLNKSDTALMLSNRFARDTAALSMYKLNKADTALMLSNRFARDTAALSMYKLNSADTADMLSSRFARDTAALSMYKLNSADTADMLSNRFARDTAALSLYKLNSADTAAMLSTRFARDTAALAKYKLNKADTAAMLSNRFARDTAALSKYKLNKADTAAMLSNYLAALNNLRSTKLNTSDTTAMLADYLAALNDLRSTKVNYTDTAAMLGDYLAALNDLRNTKLNAADTANLSLWKLNAADTVALSKYKLNKADTAAMLSNRFARDTAALAKYKLNKADTAAMLSNRFARDTAALAKYKLNKADTAAMLSNYLAALNNLRSTKLTASDTAALSTWKLNAADTAAMLSNYLAAINDLRSTKLTAADTANLSLWKLNAADTANLSLWKLNAADTANLSLWKLNKADTAALSTWKLNKADTAAMLSNYLAALNNLRSTKLTAADTAALSTWKLNKADTASMLSNYLAALNDLRSTKLTATDTAALSLWKLNAADTAALSRWKLNKADTASMLSNYLAALNNLRSTKLTATDTAALSTWKLNKADTAVMLSNRFARDTVALSNYKLNKADTAAMLSSRFARDTVALSKYKLNKADTSLLLQRRDTSTLSNRIDALSSGSNKFTADLKVNFGGGSFGKYTDGQTIPAVGKTIDQVFYDILTTVIHPTYTPPSANLSINSSNGISSGNVEIGANLGTLTLVPTFYQNRGGPSTNIVYKKGGVTITNTDVPAALTSTISYSVTYTYSVGTTVQQNNIGQDDVTNQVPAGSVSSSNVSYTPASYKYWGVSTNTAANITDADIINNSIPAAGGNKEWATSKSKGSFTITGSGVAGPVKYAFYAFPSSTPGNVISSILAGGFESISAFDHITRIFKNASNYDVQYDIYVQKNSGTDNVTLIIN